MPLHLTGKSRDFGVREVDANGKVVFELKVGGEVHGSQLMLLL